MRFNRRLRRLLEHDVVAASHSAPVLATSSESRPGVEPGADREFELVPAAGDLLPAGGALAGDSTTPSDCPVPDMAARTPSAAGAVGPAVLVEQEAVLGVAVALPHKRLSAQFGARIGSGTTLSRLCGYVDCGCGKGVGRCYPQTVKSQR